METGQLTRREVEAQFRISNRMIGRRVSLQGIEPDRDHWRHQTETLSRNVSELITALYCLGEQKAIATCAKRSPWWACWNPA